MHSLDSSHVMRVGLIIAATAGIGARDVSFKLQTHGQNVGLQVLLVLTRTPSPNPSQVTAG